MGIDRALAHQAEALVNGEIAARRWEQFVRPGDFLEVFGDMRLDPHVRVLGSQLAGAAQLRIGATGREPRGDGIAQAVLAVPADDQRFGIDQRLLGLVAHAVRAVPVLQYLAGDQAQAALLRLAHQGIDRGWMRGTECQRRGHPVPQQLVEKEDGRFGGMCRVDKARLVRKSVVLQPGQQALRWRADHVGLRKVDVQVDEARREDAPRQMLDRHARIVGRQRGIGAHGPHHLLALGIGPDHQQSVLFIKSGTVVGKTQDGGAEGFHCFAILP